MKIITKAEALTIMMDVDAERMPYMVINEAGKKAVSQFVFDTAWQPAKHSLDSWYSYAEQVANDASEGESIVIEMRSVYTVTRVPCTLRLDAECFDWAI